ncbi:MAG: hypothetical protein KGH54_03065 [Candidatus Micrarchaeota archaeon]|nr:hypothetical protein [Candidatus Micrarchaeota archaeon]
MATKQKLTAKQSLEQGKCVECGKDLNDIYAEKKETKLGLFCADDYYQQLGDHIEKNPLGSMLLKHKR